MSGGIPTPHVSALFKNTTVNAVEKFLGAAIGISENEHRPPRPTRDPLEANFRHALLFSFQDQNDIDSKQRLFHRQGEDFVSQAIKDTLPYFLGAIDEDRLLKQAQLDEARRQLRQLERQLREAETLDSNTFPRARAVLEEAKEVALIDERTVALNYESILAILRHIAEQAADPNSTVVADGEDILAGLVADTLDGPVPLSRMGSGENWVGYHVLAHLALHKWFRQKNRPVPGFLIFDQPSQAHYPPDRDAEGSIDVLPDEDQRAVLQLFKVIALAAAELAPDLQIIVSDHADLNPEWFASAVVERWRGGKKLVPESWLQ